jgi:mRNA-degrading endonuclease RelE of RelBE toxin-antitoxin system
MMRRKSPHLWFLEIRPEAHRAFDRLSSDQKAGIFRRLRELLRAEDPYSLPFVEMLKDKSFERMRRFRAGDYRVFFVIQFGEITHLKHTYKGTLFLFDVRDRKEAY